MSARRFTSATRRSNPTPAPAPFVARSDAIFPRMIKYLAVCVLIQVTVPAENQSRFKGIWLRKAAAQRAFACVVVELETRVLEETRGCKGWSVTIHFQRCSRMG
jgi:hypothetical protein